MYVLSLRAIFDEQLLSMYRKVLACSDSRDLNRIAEIAHNVYEMSIAIVRQIFAAVTRDAVDS